MQQWIIHIDMDAFFASVEQLLAPELKGRPVIVGHENRGVVCAASYEARVFGVHSAMPIMRAKKMCPHGVFVPPRHRVYEEVSHKIIEIFNDFSPVVEQASIDEAYIDATGMEGIFGSAAELGWKIKDAVFLKTGLTCSVGIAPVKFLAKIASDVHKPDGLYIIEPEGMENFLRSLPVARIPGVGPRTQEVLTRLGVKTAGDVWRLPAGVLESRLGKMGELILRRAKGIDPSRVEPCRAPKSEGCEHTLDRDTLDRECLRKYLLYQSERVAAGVRKMGTAGRTVTLKVKFSDFRQITRSHTFDLPTASTKEVYHTVCLLLDRLELNLPVRLIGVSLSNFAWSEKKFAGQQSGFLPGLELCRELKKNGRVQSSSAHMSSRLKNDDAGTSLDAAIDRVREVFGRDLIKRASLLKGVGEDEDV